MQPSSRQLIEAIAAAIDDVILPQVEEKQAASSLRAARTLLEHLAVRVEIEPDIIAADNRDASEALAAMMALLGKPADPVDLGEGFQGAVAANRTLQERLDAVARALPPESAPAGASVEVRALLRDYIDRRHARERPMIFPAFLGTPF